MTDIPDEIMERAKRLDRSLEGMLHMDENGPYITVGGVEEIARALMEAEARGEARGLGQGQREGLEEAAKVARRYEETWRPAAGFGDRAIGAKVIADTIEAAAIRKRGQE
jgi:hypothetical protein